MNTLRNLLLAVPALMIATAALAQDPAYDPKAKAILDEVSKTAKAYTSISANFTITLKKAGSNTPDTKTGSLILKGDKYKVTINNKVGDKMKKEEYYNDGKTTWTYVEKDNEVTIDCFDPSKTNDNGFSPSNIFNIHEKGFKYLFIQEKKDSKGRTIQEIQLTPEKPEKKNYHQIRVFVDKDKKQIVELTFKGKDGSTTNYKVDSFTPNTPVTDASFQFDTKAHPGVEVVDLRECAACPCNKQ